MKSRLSQKRISANQPLTELKQIYEQAAQLRQKFLIKETDKAQNQVLTFVPFHNFLHKVPINRERQIVQNRLGQLNRLRILSGGSNNNIQATKKSSRTNIENHIIKQLRDNDQNFTRYATMGNVLHLNDNKRKNIKQEPIPKTPTCIKTLKKGNQRYSSAKNFVLKDSKDKVIESTNQKNNRPNKVNKDQQKSKQKVIRLIRFLKNSESKPVQIKIKMDSEIPIQLDGKLTQKVDRTAQEQKKIPTPWSVLLKKTNPQIIAEIQELQQIQNQRQFTPIGSAKHSRTNSRSESRTSFTMSSKKQSSSYLSSRLLLCNTKKDNSPKKYLRKGARIRQALLKQLMDPNDPYHNDNNEMAYLREYDQWMPSALVQHKRQQLQQFLGVFLGAKKDEHRSDFQLQKMELVYL